MITIAQAPSFPGKYTIDQTRLQANIPSNWWHTARIFQKYSKRQLNEELAGQWSQSEAAKNFEWKNE